MEWSNDKIIEFLEVFQTEPCLWDTREKAHKNRGAQTDAWRRIVQVLPFQTTVQDLKKKKESLMGYYRIHLNRYKKSLKPGAGISDIYITNWFAFDIMHSFLKPIYEGNHILNIEPTSPFIENVIESETSEDQETNGHGESQTGDMLQPSTPKHQGMKCPDRSQFHFSQSTEQYRSVMEKLPIEIAATKKQMDEAFNYIKSLSNQRERHDFDEYDHFASMIAAKIRKISDLDEREILMNSIQNLVFQSLVKNKNINTLRSSSVLSWSVASNDRPFDIENGSSYSMQSNDTQERSYSAALKTDIKVEEYPIEKEDF